MWNWIEKAKELQESGQAFAAVTVTRVVGSTPREVGAKLIVTPHDFAGTIGGGRLEALALDDARKCIAERKSQSFKYPLCATAGQCCGGSIEILVEAMACGPQLYVFG